MPSETLSSEHKTSTSTETHEFSAILSDFDGTIVDSTPAIIKYWESVGKKYNIDPATILATSHGRRSIDIFQDIDPANATWENVCALEGQIPLQYGSDAIEIPGARTLLASLETLSAPWAIVTSGTRPLITGWLKILALAEPKHMITAEMVSKGKPDPECYRIAFERLGVAGKSGGRQALVLEDAPAGARAGKAAGFKVLAVATTHRVEELRAAGADWIVEDLRSVAIGGFDDGAGCLTVEIRGIIL